MLDNITAEIAHRREIHVAGSPRKLSRDRQDELKIAQEFGVSPHSWLTKNVPN